MQTKKFLYARARKTKDLKTKEKEEEKEKVFKSEETAQVEELVKGADSEVETSAQGMTAGGMTITTSAVIENPALADDWSAARE